MTRPGVAATLAAVMGATLLLPWERLDPAVSRFYYAPPVPHGSWQDPRWIPWGVLAHLTTFVAIGLALAGVVRLVRALAAPAPGAGAPSAAARPAIVLLLGLALGPGLLVNVILKDHWHRPRPRQTLGLGGDFAYVPPFRIGPVGKSFPCGHSAVGFACVALAGFVDARRRQVRIAVVAAALLLGAILGLGRVATGAHFVSDVVWSALLTCAVVLAVDAAVDWSARRRPAERFSSRSRSDAEAPAARWPGRAVAVAAAGTAALATALLCFPFRREAAAHAFPIPDSGGTLDLRVEVGHARLLFEPPGAAVLTVESRHDGFGVPWGRIEEKTEAGAALVRYRLGGRGWFADLEGTTILKVPADAVKQVEIEVADGHLTLIDESAGAALPAIRCLIRQGALRLRGLSGDQLELIAH